MAVRDTEDVIAVFLQAADNLHARARGLWRKGFAGEIHDPQAAGSGLLQCLRRMLELSPQIATYIRRSEEKGCSVDRSEEFARAVNDLTSLEASFSNGWPLFDVAELEAARLAIGRGEAESAEDILREIQGTH